MRHLFTPRHTAYIEKNCVRLRCVVTNIRSIVNKLNELAVYATINSVDIFGITETHLSIDLFDSLICLNQQYIGFFVKTVTDMAGVYARL